MSFDPNDPRIQALLRAMKSQTPGKPMFGGSAHRASGGAGGRGLANYYRPGGPGINFNPLAAQMSMGAPGLLGLNSGHDSNPDAPAQRVPGGPTDPVGGAPAPSQPYDAAPSATPDVGTAPPVTPGGLGGWAGGGSNLNTGVQAAATTDPSQATSAAQALLDHLLGNAPNTSAWAAGQGHTGGGARQTGLFGQY